MAWEGRRPANIGVLLADPGWEARFFKLVVDGEDEESRAARLDGWIVWEAELFPGGHIAQCTAKDLFALNPSGWFSLSFVV
jgi:hypothetical protein